MPEQVKLSINIKNEMPVELNDLADSFKALSDEFGTFASKQGQSPDFPGEAKLYVKEIKKGSIIADLINYVSPQIDSAIAIAVPAAGTTGAAALAAMSNANTVYKFGEFLKKGYDSLFRRTKDRESLDKSSLKNLAQVLAPIVKDPGSKIEITTGDIIIGNVYHNISYNSSEANKIKWQIDLEINKKEQPDNSIYKKQVLIFYQTRNAIGNKTGDKGKISTISPRDVKILFSDDGLKKQIIDGDENLFHWGYVVDVEVTMLEGKPIAYKVVRLHDKFELPSEEDLV